MKTIGIDPGCTGAIVVMALGQPIEWTLMPTMKVGTNTRVNGAALGAFLRNHLDGHALLELVGPMPGNSPNSMFTFGHAAGTAEGILQGLGIPYTLATPVKWKTRAGLIGKDKDASRTRGIQLWPHWRDLDAKIKGQAYAEAALIAKFAEPNA